MYTHILEVLVAKAHFYWKDTYIETTWQKLSPAIEQLQVTLFDTSVTQLGLLLHGSMSKFQSFLPSDSAISSRAFSIYTYNSELSAKYWKLF